VGTHLSLLQVVESSCPQLSVKLTPRIFQPLRQIVGQRFASFQVLLNPIVQFIGVLWPAIAKYRVEHDILFLWNRAQTVSGL
jgi:hypothetical protein